MNSSKPSDQTKKIVVTGGPGSGKTCIILALERLGEHIVREAATDHIMYMQAQGIACPWEHDDFQIQIAQLQKFHESRIHSDAQRIFLDRGCHDGLAYLEPNSTNYKKVEQISQTSHYDLVFVVEPLDFTEKTVVRRENREEAEALAKKFVTIYRQAGFEPIMIKPGPLVQRVDAVMKEVKKHLDVTLPARKSCKMLCY